MIKSLSQSLVAAAFIGTGLVAGMDTGTTTWTPTEAAFPAIVPAGLVEMQPAAPVGAEPIRTALRYR